MRKINSIEEFEYDNLEEIPRETLKNDFITTENYVKMICMNIPTKNNNRIYLYEFMGEFKGFKFWKSFSAYKQRYTNEINDLVVEQDIYIDNNQELDTTFRYIEVMNDNYIKLTPVFETDTFIQLDKNFDEMMKKNEYHIEINFDNLIFNNKKGIDLENKEEILNFLKNELAKETYNTSEEIKKLKKEQLDSENLRLQNEKKIKERYDLNSFYEGEVYWNRLKIDEQFIHHGSSNEMETYMLESNVNEILPYNFWEDFRNNNSDLGIIENYLINKKINYTLKCKEKNYNIKFKDEKVILDDVQIPKSKIVFFVKRATGNSDRIEFLKKLSARALSLLEITEIMVYDRTGDYHIPVLIETENGKDFKVSILEKQIVTEFETLKRVFFPNNALNIDITIQPENLVKFICGDLKLKKQELFDYIKKVKILQKIQNENN